jgi:hypothetical protein
MRTYTAAPAYMKQVNWQRLSVSSGTSLRQQPWLSQHAWRTCERFISRLHPLFFAQGNPPLHTPSGSRSATEEAEVLQQVARALQVGAQSMSWAALPRTRLNLQPGCPPWQEHEGRSLSAVVLRAGTPFMLTLTPTRWVGRGLLGCEHTCSIRIILHAHKCSCQLSQPFIPHVSSTAGATSDQYHSTWWHQGSE